MTVRDLIEMFIDDNCQEFSIYDNSAEEVTFTGYLEDLPEEYEYAEVTSIDNLSKGTDVLTVNVDI